MAADVYGEPPHVGRGGWSWYTGSAGWMFRVLIESVLGLRIEAGRFLVIAPCISANWPSCGWQYRLPDGKTSYHVCIENPHGKEHGVVFASINGHPAEVHEGAARIPVVGDGETHAVVVRL